MRSPRPEDLAGPGEGPEAVTRLFDPLRLREIELRHRIVVSPMAMYQAGPDGCATDWHLAHYGRMAIGGAAMVMVESTATEASGRIGYACLGIWNDRQVASLRRIARFISQQGSVAAIQINHTGRKGSWRRPWDGYGPLTHEDAELRDEPPWPTAGPSAVSTSDAAPVPAEMSVAQIRDAIATWVAAARNADAAEFDVLELHAAHGYLIHQFLSPISNRRSDGYGGDRGRRMRFALEMAEAVRSVWPSHKPLLVRVSAVDGVEGGITLDDTIALSRELGRLGVDAIDCSSGGIGGIATNSRLPRGPGFQVPFAEAIRREADIATIAVGLITRAEQAAQIVDAGRADLVAIGREVLIYPNWPNAARTALRPEEGHAGWPRETGWWLDQREKSIAASSVARS